MEYLPLVMFTAGVSGSDPERWVALACRANTLDLVARAAEVPCLRPIILVTPLEGWADELSHLPVELMADEPGETFHFGRRLREVTARFGLRRFLYVGGGAGVLLGASDLAALAERALAIGSGV
ncbi:MAG: hypothetical protein QME94_14635, partial [Anaerolineae bacterium]|nr:hypothetical protein [Anaerolineae bacterium]